MQHTVVVEENGILRLNMHGDLSLSEIMELGKKIITHATQTEDGGEKVRILIVYTLAGKIQSAHESFTGTLDIYHHLSPRWHVAFVATTGDFRVSNQRAVEMAGRQENCKFFETVDEALAWLDV